MAKPGLKYSESGAIVTDDGSISANTYTQTYATADRTVAAATASAPAALVLTGTNIAAKTASDTLIDAVNTNAGTVATSLDQAQKDIGTKINALRTDNIALAADVLQLRKVVTAIIDDLQARGLIA